MLLVQLSMGTLWIVRAIPAGGRIPGTLWPHLSRRAHCRAHPPHRESVKLRNGINTNNWARQQDYRKYFIQIVLSTSPIDQTSHSRNLYLHTNSIHSSETWKQANAVNKQGSYRSLRNQQWSWQESKWRKERRWTCRRITTCKHGQRCPASPISALSSGRL